MGLCRDLRPDDGGNPGGDGAESFLSDLPNLCCAVGLRSLVDDGLTFPSDLFDQKVVGTVTGLSGFGAGMAGRAVALIVGRLVDRFSYGPAFLFVTCLPLIATASVLALIRPHATGERATS